MKETIIIYIFSMVFNLQVLGFQDTVNIESEKKIKIYSSAEVRGNIIDLSLFLRNRTSESIYVLNDDFIFYNLLDSLPNKNNVKPLKNELILFENINALEKLEDKSYTIQKTNEFPAYYISSLNSSDTFFSFNLSMYKTDNHFSEENDYYVKIKLYYFLESDIEKINELLNVDISAARLQSFNSNTTYHFSITEPETFLDCALSNLNNIDSDKLEIFFKDYLKEIEGTVRIEYFFRK